MLMPLIAHCLDNSNFKFEKTAMDDTWGMA